MDRGLYGKMVECVQIQFKLNISHETHIYDAIIARGQQVDKKAPDSYGFEQVEMACSVHKKEHVVYEWYMI